MYRKRAEMGMLSALALVVAFLSLPSTAASAAGNAFRFDCGTTESPVMPGYQRLTAADVYSQAKGYGWEVEKPSSVEFENPGPSERAHWVARDKIFEENLTDLNRDAVVSEDALVFRADVPNGTYRISLLIGDMAQATGSVDVYVNGQLAEERVAAWHPGAYRRLLQSPAGWWTRVDHTASVEDGIIRIRLAKNQTYYDEQMAEQMTWLNPYKVHYWSFAEDKNPPYYYIGWPFVHNSVMAIDIVPDLLPPVVGDNNKLKLTRPIDSPALEKSISLFNEEDFDGALRALSAVNKDEAKTAKALVQLWLSGRPEVEEEKTLVPEAIAALREYVSAHPEENQVAELLEDAETFQKGLTIHLTRGHMRIIDGQATQKNHFVEINKAIGLLWLIKEDSPLYYKTQLYIARAAHMHLPYIPTLGTEAEILKKLEKKFPDNRYVKFFLHWTWEPYGDGTSEDDWYMVDYSPKVEGAPEWVRELYPAFSTLLDWTEWYIRHKQRPEGTIGGGLSDDVEIVGAFGYVAFTSRGVSDLVLNGARKLCEGNWRYGGINDEIGYYRPFADAEHTAEPTGDTLGMMVTIDYGNPLWIERSMKTGKLIRDLWTDYDNNGHRHFRSNYFNATQIGSGDQANDSWINYRAVTPARAALWYNQNPTISKLLVEIADGWLAAAMSTERGKPKGVIPAQVSFPDGIIGGTNSPNWYTASHPQGEYRNYDWGPDSVGYKSYMHDLFLTAYEQTGDAKYLEPLGLEYELAARYGKAPEKIGGTRLQEIEIGGDGSRFVLERWDKLSKALEEREAPPEDAAPKDDEPEVVPAEPGSEKWVAENLGSTAPWLTAKRMLEGREGSLEDEITREQIALHGGFTRRMFEVRWPLMTTEASATDRAAFVGILNPFFASSGGRIIGRYVTASITYENTTRDFAAAVLATDPQGFRVIYYSMTPDVRNIGVVPWDLEPGGTYILRFGPDEDEDEAMDEVFEEREFNWPQRGTPIYVTIRPRRTYVIDVDQVERGKGPTLAPDPGLSDVDISYDEEEQILMARIHNVGSKGVRHLQVAAYDGNPDEGGTLIGEALIPNIEAPTDLERRAVSVGFNWQPEKEAHDIYVIVDPNDEIKDEITTFNNVAHKILPEKADKAPAIKYVDVLHSGRR